MAAGRGAAVAGPHFPHRWRHSYATSLIRRGVDVSKVQRLLGHSRLATTERYVHLVIEDLAAAVDQAFPDTTPQPPASPGEAVAPVLRLLRGDADSA
jgi:site-specific recombinase XerD